MGDWDGVRGQQLCLSLSEQNTCHCLFINVAESILSNYPNTDCTVVRGGLYMWVCVCLVVSDSWWPHGLTVALRAPLTMAFSKQEYWSGLPCLLPGDLPNPRIELESPMSFAFQVDPFTTVPPRKLSCLGI